LWGFVRYRTFIAVSGCDLYDNFGRIVIDGGSVAEIAIRRICYRGGICLFFRVVVVFARLIWSIVELFESLDIRSSFRNLLDVRSLGLSRCDGSGQG